MIVLSVACSRCHHGWTQEPPEVGLTCPRCGSPLRAGLVETTDTEEMSA